MQIVALRIISLSEIAKVVPDITMQWIDDNQREFLTMLYDLGVNTRQPVEVQDNVWHYNFFREATVCTRWVGNERTDEQWISSGYASQAAIDKSKGSSLLIDLYRLKGQAE